MQMHLVRRRLLAFVAGLAIIACSGWAAADPPSRVARLGYMAGAVSFSPAGENDWVQATRNRPLGTGDRLWTDEDVRARAEIQVGGAMIRMHGGTSLTILNLDDRIAQLQVTQGALNVRVRRLDPGQVVEVDTPNLAFTLRQPGEYRIDVDPENDATTIVVRRGSGEAYGEEGAYLIDARQAYRFNGTGLRDYQLVGTPRFDDFDRWASSRDRNYDASRSARYVSSDVVGLEDLDANGTWRVDAGYGNVWMPNHVDADWTPYSDGHWAWVDPWGWTWIDDASWGYAVSHYGRWANLRGRWAWVPGPVRSRAYYAPALVAFVGGNNFQLNLASGSIGAVAWFPLAPREVYRPSYPVSRRYFENLNRSNTTINTTVINNQYNTTNVTNVVYANRQIAGAVVAEPTTAFVQAQPVGKGRQRVTREALVGRAVMLVPAVVPTEKSVRGTAARRDKPPPRVFERPVVARSAVPAFHGGFAAQREKLAEKPGQPLDAAKRRELKGETAVPPPVVKVLAPRPEAVKDTPPPVATRQEERRNRSDGRRESSGPLPATALPPEKAAVPVKPADAVVQVPEANGKPEPDDRRGRREKAMAAPPEKPVVAAPSGEAVAQPAATRGRPEAASKREQREPPALPPPEKAAVPAKPAETVVQVPEASGKSEPDDRRGRREKAMAAPPEKPVVAAPSGEAAAQPAAPRGRPEAASKREQREPPTFPPPENAGGALPSPGKPAAKPPVAVSPAESRGRNKPESLVPPVVQLKPVAPPEIPQRPVKVPEVPVRESRERPEQRGNGGPPPTVVTPPRAAEIKPPPPQAAPSQPPVPPPVRATPPPPAPQAAPHAAPPAAERPTDRRGERPRKRDDPQPDDDKPKRDR